MSRTALLNPLVRHWISGLCAMAIAASASAGWEPARLLDALEGNSVLFLIIAIGGFLAADRVLAAADGAVLRWSVPLGTALASAETVGISLLGADAGLGLFLHSEPALLAWAVVHLLGVGAGAILALTLLLSSIDRRADRDGTRPPRDSTNRGLVGLARRATPLSLLAVFGIVALLRLPYLLLWWPGLVPFDTFRSYSYVLGIGVWEQYEPIGHSLLIGAMIALGDALGLGDTGTIALGATLQLLTSSLACGFALVRVASWGISAKLWFGLLAWFALSPVLALFSITLVKDMPFTSALVVFMVAYIEVLRGRGTAPRWVWILLTASAVLVMVLRNNGLFVVVIGLVVLGAIHWRAAWKHMLAVILICASAFAVYAGPLTAALGARPGPGAESWSVPLQQIARIADEHEGSLTEAQRSFIDQLFVEADATTIGDRYDPYISDPVKADANGAWEERSLGEFLAGWSDLVLDYPGSALEATLAGTVGYWAPGAPSYDGLVLGSSNGVRGVVLDIDAGVPEDGPRGFLQRHDLLGQGFASLPVVGLLLSPGFVTWCWVIALAMVVRSRQWTLAAAFVPASVLLLTVLAGPVSGGMRYSLGLIAGLPIAVALTAVAGERRRQLDVSGFGRRVGNTKRS